MGKLDIIETETAEDKFSTSTCPCPFCVETHVSIIEWNLFIPKNKLQKNMKKVVSKLEGDIRNGTVGVKRRRISE